MPLACAGSSFVAPHHLDRAIGSSLRGFRRGGSVTAPKLGVGHAWLHQASGAHGGERPSARIVAAPAIIGRPFVRCGRRGRARRRILAQLDRDALNVATRHAGSSTLRQLLLFWRTPRLLPRVRQVGESSSRCRL